MKQQQVTDGHLSIQGLAGLHPCQSALAALQVLDHHLAKSIAHVHLDALIIFGELHLHMRY